MPEKATATVRCYRERRVSKKTGTIYEVLVLCFENGFKMDVFLSNEQQFIVASEVPSING